VFDCRGVRIADEEIVYYKGEGSGVGVVAKKHGGGRATRRSWDKRPDWGRPGTVLRTSQKRKGLPWEWRRKGRRPKFVRVGMEMEDTSMRTDSGEERLASK
jgi:hypothetical protein